MGVAVEAGDVEVGGEYIDDSGEYCGLAQPLNANGFHGRSVPSVLVMSIEYARIGRNKITNFRKIDVVRIQPDGEKR